MHDQVFDAPQRTHGEQVTGDHARGTTQDPFSVRQSGQTTTVGIATRRSCVATGTAVGTRWQQILVVKAAVKETAAGSAHYCSVYGCTS
jgi:hypothetical protein